MVATIYISIQDLWWQLKMQDLENDGRTKSHGIVTVVHFSVMRFGAPFSAPEFQRLHSNKSNTVITAV